MNNCRYSLCENHIFKKNGTVFLYDIKNLNLYEIDSECEKAINLLSKGVENTDINQQLISELISVGIISDGKADNEAEAEKYSPNKNIHNMVLELANDCNLNCKYCYGDGGSYGRKREMMSFETAKQAVDFLVANSGDIKELCIIFFGGEPLLNFKVMKSLIEYCKSIEDKIDKKINFAMTTNGTVLTDEIYDYIKKYNITLTLSIDGPKNVHDNYRCYVNGKGSFDVINPNIKKLLDLKKGDIMARATVCHPNLNLNDIFKEFKAMGFNSVALSLVDAKDTSELHIKPEDFKILANELDAMSEDFIDAIKNKKKYPYRLFFDIIALVYEKMKIIQPCGAGRAMIAVGTDGVLYPCQRFMGMSEYSFGNVYNGVSGKVRDEFLSTTVENKEKCTNCWARYLCGGGCPHMSAKANQTITKAPEFFCDYTRYIYELGLYMYWRLKEWDEDIFRKNFERHETEKMESEVI